MRLSSAVSGPEWPAIQRDLPGLELAVLRELAVQPEGAVEEVGKAAVGGNGAVKSVEVLFRLLREVDRGEAGHDPGVGEFGDFLGKKGAVRSADPLVPTPALFLAPACGEAREIRRAREVRRTGEEERPAVFLPSHGVDPGAPFPQGCPVRGARPGLRPEFLGISPEIPKALVAERTFSGAELESPGLLGNRIPDFREPFREIIDEVAVPAEHADHRFEVGRNSSARTAGSAGAGPPEFLKTAPYFSENSRFVSQYAASFIGCGVPWEAKSYFP